MLYKAIEEVKECGKMYKTALKKFPNSGTLYNEYGEMMWSKKELLRCHQIMGKRH